MTPRPPRSTLFPYTTLFRSLLQQLEDRVEANPDSVKAVLTKNLKTVDDPRKTIGTHHVLGLDRKSTRLNSSHSQISYAVFCLKKKTNNTGTRSMLMDPPVFT